MMLEIEGFTDADLRKRRADCCQHQNKANWILFKLLDTIQTILLSLNQA